jgi:16S rRNA processing protein RimM
MTYQTIGKIQKTFGAGGELLIAPCADAQWDTTLPFFVCMDGLWTPFFVIYEKDQAARKIVVFENMENPRLAQTLVGKDLCIGAATNTAKDTAREAARLPKEISASTQYTGYSVFDGKQAIGTITQRLDFNGNVCFEIEGTGGDTVLIPAHPDFIVKTDRKRRCLYMNLPEGILDS